MGKTRTRKTVSATPTRAYAKVALSAEETLHRLWQRGLRIDDRPSNLRMLRSIGHFRLLVYMRRFQNPATKRFWPRTRFSDVVELYAFDRRLRSVTMDAIERIEVALRAALSNPLAIDYGSHWYVERDRFADLRHYARILDQIARECETRKGSALTHYYRTYASPDLPPIWLVCERLSLGALSRIFSALDSRPEGRRAPRVAGHPGYGAHQLAAIAHRLTQCVRTPRSPLGNEADGIAPRQASRATSCPICPGNDPPRDVLRPRDDDEGPARPARSWRRMARSLASNVDGV